MEEYPRKLRKHKELVVLAVCALMFLIGLPCITQVIVLQYDVVNFTNVNQSKNLNQIVKNQSFSLHVLLTTARRLSLDTFRFFITGTTTTIFSHQQTMRLSLVVSLHDSLYQIFVTYGDDLHFSRHC